MIEITKLSRQIRDVLNSDPNHAPVESLAAQYARHCHDAAQRLDSCASMLEKGSDYQALQLAETEPVLLDLIAALSFAEAQQWSSYCTENQLPVPEKFDSKAVQALDRLYSKGISPNHPLYRDYRAAVSSRDDAKSIRIIRSIVRVNPTDANAKSELARLENKLFQVKLQELRKSLTQRDDASTISHLSELERLARPDRLAEISEYTQACVIRKAEARREALASAERLCETLDEERRAGAWRMVGDIVARIRALQGEHEFLLPEQHESQCVEMHQFFLAQRAEWEQTMRYNQALGALGGFVERMDSQLLARSTLRLEEVENLQVELNQLWTGIESFKRSVPETFVMRVRSSAGALRTELARLQRQRRIKIISAAAVAVAVVSLIALFTVSAMRAGDFATQLAQLREAGQVAAAEKMLIDVREQHSTLASQPKLKARLDEMEQWVKSEHARFSDLDKRITDLETALKLASVKGDPSELTTQMDSVAQLLPKIATDLRQGPAGRVLILRNQFEAQMAVIREQLVKESDLELSALATLASQKLLYDQPKAIVQEAFSELEPRLKRLESAFAVKNPALQFPAAHQSRAGELRKRLDLFAEELQKLTKLNESLLKATTLESYMEVLLGFKDSQLKQEQEVIDARRLLQNMPLPDDLLAQLLLPGDPAGWAAAKAETTGSSLLPQGVVQQEKDRLVALRKDDFINNVWEVEFVDYKRKNKTSTLYLKGELQESKADNGVFQTVTWKGNLYYPGPTTEIPTFAIQNITMKKSKDGEVGDGEVRSKKLSSPSECLRFLELNRMTDENASKFERSLLDVIDILIRNKNTNVVFKAYCFQQLTELLRLRPYAWGWQYAASFQADVAALDGICGGASLRSSDWLLDAKNTQLGPKLTTFFNSIENRRYYREALMHREILKGVLSAGLKYCGFIDGSGRAHLLGEAQGRKELWALTREGPKIVRYFAEVGLNEKNKSNIACFSPVLFVPIDRQEFLVKLASQIFNSSGPRVTLPPIPWCDGP